MHWRPYVAADTVRNALESLRASEQKDLQELYYQVYVVAFQESMVEAAVITLALGVVFAGILWGVYRGR